MHPVRVHGSPNPVVRHRRNAATTRLRPFSPASAGPSRRGVNAEPERCSRPVVPRSTTSVRGVSRRGRGWEAQHHPPQPKEAPIARAAGSWSIIPGAAVMCRHFRRPAVSTLPTCSISGLTGVPCSISSACATKVRSLVIRISVPTFTTNRLPRVPSSGQVGNIRSTFQSCSSTTTAFSLPTQCCNLPRSCT